VYTCFIAKIVVDIVLEILCELTDLLYYRYLVSSLL
jgi:hypothetical protein